MRVLQYNWVDPEDLAGRGGGVRVYMQGLVRAQAECAGMQVVTLASGLAHDLGARAPRWRCVRKGHFEIVNARPLAPSQADFASPAQISHPPTESTFRDLLMRTGPYDVVHFHTLEGLPAQVLAIAAAQARVVLSLHNYHTLCPQVNLWWQERGHCTDFAGGARCAICLPQVPNMQAVRRAYQVETAFARLGIGPGRWPYNHLLRPALHAGWRGLKRLSRRDTSPPAAPARSAPFAQRRAQMIALINAHCAQVLAVSDCTRAIAQAHGMDRVQTLYIGTGHAREWARTQPRDWPARFGAARPLHLTYLGYMRRDKGFDFLLEALRALPPDMARRVHLRVAARRGPPAVMARLIALRGHLAGLDWQDGYRHADLNRLLNETDLGVVPPLWQDNLPQTALEMHARHIPLLTSDRGGARELGGCDTLTFRAGDTADFTARLSHVLGGAICLRRYWARARVPQSMDQHAQDLIHRYRQLSRESCHERPDPYRYSENRHLVDTGVPWPEPRRTG